MAKHYSNSGFNYRKKFTPNVKKKGSKKPQSANQRKKLYTESWDDIRRKVYRRDGHRCAMCGKKGKLNAHHIVPVRISKDNSLSNLVTVCDKCHSRLESVGFAVLKNGGHQHDVRKIELQMISEAKQKRREEYKNKISGKDFAEKAKEIHGNKYDYSLVEYENNRTKVKIICPKHGEFEQRPDNHLSGKGCSMCSSNKKIKFDEFISEAKKIHGEKYDYSLAEYVNYNTKIKIINNDGRIFEQTPKQHLLTKVPRGLTIINTENFILRAKEVHGDKYDYSLVECKNAFSYIEIICPKHGKFKQIAINHLKGFECNRCAGFNRTTEEFINEATDVHGNKYDYSLVNYNDAKTKVKIICPEHGEFVQFPGHHLYGCGCPACNNSKGENYISDIFYKNNIDFIREYKFDDCKNIRKLKFDFYLPMHNICIEFDGKQHFFSSDFFGGVEALKYIQQNDIIKNKYCNDNNITLIRIRYDDDLDEKLNYILEEQKKKQEPE